MCVALAGCQHDRFPQGIKHVVVIGIDGLSSQGLIEARTPRLDSLLRNGAYSYTDRCVIPTVSMPNWHAMISGAGPEATGVYKSSWSREQYDFPAVAVTGNHTFPSIFRMIRLQRPEAEIGAIYHWSGFGDIVEDDIVNLSETYPTALETARRSAEYILDKKPALTFIQLDEVDHFGHQDGHMSPGYLKEVEATDGYAGLIIDAVQQAGIAQSTLIMVVSDHGGIFHKHGDYTYEEFSTPVIFAGKGVRKNYRIRQQIYKYDVAANIAFALGLEAPQVWVGRPTRAAYEAFDEPANLWTAGVDVLPPPRFYTESFYPPHGALTVDEPAEVKIAVPEGAEGEIRYTTDGTAPTRASALYQAPFKVNTYTVVTARLFSSTGESPQAVAQYRVADTGAGNGLDYAFYHLPGAQEMPPSFATLKPAATGVCYEAGVKTPELTALKAACPKDFGIVYTGWIEIDKPDTYTFLIWSSGAHRLYINSGLVFCKNFPDGGGTSGKLRLEKGRYPVRIEFFSHGGSDIDFYYSTADLSERIVPANSLFREKIQ